MPIAIAAARSREPRKNFTAIHAASSMISGQST